MTDAKASFATSGVGEIRGGHSVATKARSAASFLFNHTDHHSVSVCLKLHGMDILLCAAGQFSSSY